jgi:hypothetical protein
MSHTREAARGGPREARIVDQHHGAGPRDEDEIEAADDRARQWYQLRPEPRRRTDFMGFNSTWWMALGVLGLLLGVAFPFPWLWLI